MIEDIELLERYLFDQQKFMAEIAYLSGYKNLKNSLVTLRVEGDDITGARREIPDYRKLLKEENEIVSAVLDRANTGIQIPVCRLHKVLHQLNEELLKNEGKQ